GVVLAQEAGRQKIARQQEERRPLGGDARARRRNPREPAGPVRKRVQDVHVVDEQEPDRVGGRRGRRQAAADKQERQQRREDPSPHAPSSDMRRLRRSCALMTRSSTSMPRPGQSARDSSTSIMERYHQIDCSDVAREMVRTYSAPSRRIDVAVLPQFWISSATVMSMARGSASARWARNSCLQARQGRSSPRPSYLGSSASIATPSTTGPNFSRIFRSSSARCAASASSSAWWRMPATSVTSSQPYRARITATLAGCARYAIALVAGGRRP